MLYLLELGFSIHGVHILEEIRISHTWINTSELEYVFNDSLLFDFQLVTWRYELNVILVVDEEVLLDIVTIITQIYALHVYRCPQLLYFLMAGVQIDIFDFR